MEQVAASRSTVGRCGGSGYPLASGFDALLGSCAELARVKAAAARVAPTDLSVLIEGETGTGKEVLARAIHESSRRAGGPLVPVNCASLSAELVESELFGHERGAFTGAAGFRAGKVAAAHRGTLFLDEIGGLPPNLCNGPSFNFPISLI